MFLREGTQVVVELGQAVDASDGVTPETGLTLGTADGAVILKHDGAAAVDISGRTFAAVTSADGFYHLTLTTADTDTVGPTTVAIWDQSLMLPLKRRFYVLEQNQYDALFDTSATGFNSAARVKSNLQAVNGVEATILNLASSAATIVRFTVDDTALTPTTTQFDTDLTEATANHYKDQVIKWETGALAGSAARITGYELSGGRGRFTVEAMTDAPANGNTGVIE